MFGYAGRMLHVDLTSGKTEIEGKLTSREGNLSAQASEHAPGQGQDSEDAREHAGERSQRTPEEEFDPAEAVRFVQGVSLM